MVRYDDMDMEQKFTINANTPHRTSDCLVSSILNSLAIFCMARIQTAIMPAVIAKNSIFLSPEINKVYLCGHITTMYHCTPK